MKITLEELAPYLPYGLKVVCYTEGYPEEVCTMITLSHNVLVGKSQDDGASEIYDFEDVKPILRPLSDLDKGMFDEEAEYLIARIIKGHTIHYGSLSYTTIQYLSKNHYDFQNLIMKGLAVDINTIEKQLK